MECILGYNFVAIWMFLERLGISAWLELKLWEEMAKYKGDKNVRYVSSVERIGIKKGEARVLLRQIRHRFHVLPDWIEPKVFAADRNALEEWTKRILDARSLQDIFGDDMPYSAH